MSDILLIGNLAYGQTVGNGQTIKTRILFKYIKKQLKCKLSYVDTSNWRKEKLKLLLKSISGIVRSDIIIISLSHNGKRFFLPFLYYVNKITKKKIYHFVIGGNLAEQAQQHKTWKKYLNSFEKNYVEMKRMCMDLEKCGVNNSQLIPNFKNLSKKENRAVMQPPFSVCTFSRICKEKGIEEAIDAVKKVNMDGIIRYKLTIYGNIEDNYKERFETLKEEFPDYITYGGVVPYNSSVDVLCDFFLLLFPTCHQNEGLPGTLIDAAFAGLPVIASDWNFNSDIIEDYKNGRLFPPHDVNALSSILMYYSEHPREVGNMQEECKRKAEEYLPLNALKPFFDDVKTESKDRNLL